MGAMHCNNISGLPLPSLCLDLNFSSNRDIQVPLQFYSLATGGISMCTYALPDNTPIRFLVVTIFRHI